MTSEQPPAGRPLLRVVRGDPSPEELAAVVAVLAARASAGSATPPPAPPNGWRRPLDRGPGAWRQSGLVKGTRTRASW